MSRELVLLGTGSQVPTRQRNHHAALLLWDGVGFLFDPGEGTQRQMIQAGVSVSQIHHICITHWHGDHSLGLAGLVQRIALDMVPHRVEVHYPAYGEIYFQRLRHATVFHDTDVIVPRPFSTPGVIWRGGELTLSVARLDHTIEAWGYRLVEDDGVSLVQERLDALGLAGPIVGKLVSEGRVERDGVVVELASVSRRRHGQVFAFVMDTRDCPGARALAHQADVALIESTFLEEQHVEAEAYGHLTALRTARLAAESGVGLLVLTHFSQRYQDLTPFALEAAAHHPHVHIAIDLERVAFPARRRSQHDGLPAGGLRS